MKGLKNKVQLMLLSAFLVTVACNKNKLSFGPGEEVWDPLESTCRHASLSIL